MYKCPNCGMEFNSKFCPECGTARQENKTCPQCGGECLSSAKSCERCGYVFDDIADETELPAAEAEQVQTESEQTLTEEQTASETQTAPVEENQEKNEAKQTPPVIAKVYGYLKYMPAALFALFTLLCLAFFSASVAKTPKTEIWSEVIPAKSLGNVYSLTGGKLPELRAISIVLIIFWLLCIAACAFAAYRVYKRPNKKFKPLNRETDLLELFGAATLPLYLVWLILGSVACGNVGAADGGTGTVSVGAAPVLIIVFSIIFALLAAGALTARYILLKRFPDFAEVDEKIHEKLYKTIAEYKANRAQARQNKANLNDEYRTANPAPVVVKKPTKADKKEYKKQFKNTAYYKAQNSQNFKACGFWVLLTGVLCAACLAACIYYSITKTFNGVSAALLVCAVAFGLLTPLIAKLTSLRKLKSINKACLSKVLCSVFIVLFVIFILCGALVALEIYRLGFRTDEFYESTLASVSVIAAACAFVVLAVYSVPYFIARHKVKRARLAIYGSKRIGDREPQISFEELCAQYAGYKKKLNAHKQYIRDLAAYNEQVKTYVDENLENTTNT